METEKVTYVQKGKKGAPHWERGGVPLFCNRQQADMACGPWCTLHQVWTGSDGVRFLRVYCGCAPVEYEIEDQEVTE